MSKPEKVESPPWLKDSLVQTALRKKFQNNHFRILRSELKMATAAGDNYGSIMYRMTLTVRRKFGGPKERLSVIIKCMPGGLIGEEIRRLEIFEKEEEAYTKTLPAIDMLLRQAYPDHQKLWPDCYYTQGAPDNALILEDLKEKGFNIRNRIDGLDMDHTILVLQSLAKIHASGIVLKQNNPSGFQRYEPVFWKAENTQTVKNMLTEPFAIVPADMESWENFDRKAVYIKKLKKVGENILDKVFDVWKPNELKMNVLLHGDAWVNNFMFKYDSEGNVREINFVDFQIMNINSPAMELHFFIFTSIAHELKFENIDFFLKTYIESFEDALNKLGHKLDKPYSFTELKKDFEEKNFWGFTVFFCIFPVFLVSKEEMCDTDEFFKPDTTAKFKNIYKSQEFRNILKQGLKYFEQKGVI